MSENNRKKLLEKAKLLEGKKIGDLIKEIRQKDKSSKIKTKSAVGDAIETYFKITKNNSFLPDIEHLAIELKTSPLKFNKLKTELTSKEPLSLNIINYCKEIESKGDIKKSSFYKKGKEILLIFYIHDGETRSEYIIKYVFIWKMDKNVLLELKSDYEKIIEKIMNGEAHNIHQWEHQHLTLCPKHGGKMKDPNCNKSKTPQPFSNIKAEVRAFRLKSGYINLILKRYLESKNIFQSWDDDIQKNGHVVIKYGEWQGVGKQFKSWGEKKQKVRIVSQVNAGKALHIAEEDLLGYIFFNDFTDVDTKKDYALQIDGDSMNEKRINDKLIEEDDYVLVKPDHSINSGDTIVAIDMDGAVNVKEIYKGADGNMLKSISNNKENINVDSTGYTKLGKVVDVIKNKKE